MGLTFFFVMFWFDQKLPTDITTMCTRQRNIYVRTYYNPKANTISMFLFQQILLAPRIVAKINISYLPCYIMVRFFLSLMRIFIYSLVFLLLLLGFLLLAVVHDISNIIYTTPVRRFYIHSLLVTQHTNRN